jgi:hypothetical protein
MHEVLLSRTANAAAMCAASRVHGRGEAAVGMEVREADAATTGGAAGTPAKWGVHIYDQYAKCAPCTILHLDFGVYIFFCILILGFIYVYM